MVVSVMVCVMMCMMVCVMLWIKLGHTRVISIWIFNFPDFREQLP